MEEWLWMGYMYIPDLRRSMWKSENEIKYLKREMKFTEQGKPYYLAGNL